MGKTRYCLPPGNSLPPPSVVQPLPSVVDFENTLASYQWYDKTLIAIKASVGKNIVLQHAHDSSRENDESLYETKIRIASVTKVFTVLALLLLSAQIKWDDEITKYIPGLDEEAYAGISIGALAGQTSGLGRFIRTLHYNANCY